MYNSEHSDQLAGDQRSASIVYHLTKDSRVSLVVGGIVPHQDQGANVVGDKFSYFSGYYMG